MILHLLLATAALAAPVDSSTAPAAAVSASTETARRPDPKTATQEFVRGQLLERKGDYAGALAAYENALAADPRSSYIDRQAAELSLEVGDGEKALGYAKKAAELEPQDAATLTLLGKTYWAVGRPEEAANWFKQALKLDPKSSESLYALAGLVAERSPDEARKMLTRYLEQNPDEAAEARFQLAKIELQLGRTKAAEKQLKESIALSPDDESAQARYALAQAYESDHSTDAALGAYLDLLKLEPANTALLDHIAEIYFLKDDWDSMRAMLVRAKESQNDDPTANHWLALDAEKKNDWDAAIKFVKDSSAFKEDPALSLRLSYYLTQAGRLDEAVKVLEDAHKKWPNNDQVEYFLALGYDDKKESAKAVPLLRHVLTLKPQNRDARYQLGVILEKLGKLQEAEPEFRALLADNPDDASVLNYLGYSLADRGQKLDEAESYIAKAVSLDPKNGAYMDSLGWVHYKQGKYKAAALELRKAVDLIGDDDQIWDHLGGAEFKNGDDFKAWQAWKRSESLMPSGAKLPGKAAQVERGMTPEELGAAYMDYFKVLQGGIKKVTGLCTLKGEILRRPFEYRCLFTYRGPDEIDVDLLGPLMMPVFRMRLAEQSFEMDPLKLEGVDPRAVTDGAFEALSLIREYLSGRLYGLRPALFKKTWRKRFVETADWRLMLDRGAVRVEKIIPLKESQYQLSLEEFGRTEGGRQVPRQYTITGRGFSLKVRFDNVKMVFEDRN
jgi:tetratricopeptide (TPR) repeat protein